MPHSDVSRIMVDHIPAPPTDDFSVDRGRNYAEYMRAIGVATGTSTDAEETGFWSLPALEPAPPGALPGFRAVTDNPGPEAAA